MRGDRPDLNLKAPVLNTTIVFMAGVMVHFMAHFAFVMKNCPSSSSPSSVFAII